MALRERSQTLAEMAERARCFYADYDDFDADAAKTHLTAAARPILLDHRERLAAVEEWTEASTQVAVEATAAAVGVKLGKVAQPLRIALTGQAASPGIGTTLVLVGKRRALQRIDRAVAHIDALSAAAPAGAQ